MENLTITELTLLLKAIFKHVIRGNLYFVSVKGDKMTNPVLLNGMIKIQNKALMFFVLRFFVQQKQFSLNFSEYRC